MVSIHAPREGRDIGAAQALDLGFVFQSTRPVKGATALAIVSGEHRRRFNPRAP